MSPATAHSRSRSTGIKRRPFGRIRRLPSGRYQVRYPDGAGRDIPATTTFATKSDAAAFLAKVQTDMASGKWRNPRLGQTTFRDWATQWLAANPSKRATSLARDRVVLENHVLPALGDIALAKITPVHIKRCVATMSAKLAPATVRTNIGVPKAVMNAAVEADLLARSPVRAIRLTNGPAKERPTLRLDELARLAAAVPDSYEALILIAGVLGLRWSEAVGLRVGDVDFLRRTITVRRTIAEVKGKFCVTDTKSRSSKRTLSVPAFLIDELARHISAHRQGTAQDNLVFASPRGGPSAAHSRPGRSIRR